MIFRVHGLMLLRGDDLVGPLSLSSNRWQVISSLRDRPFTMAQIARRMGLTRQGVRQVTQRLVRQGVVELIANPDHQRAHLVRLTPAGSDLLRRADSLQTKWVNRLAARLDLAELARTHVSLSKVCSVLEWQGETRSAIKASAPGKKRRTNV